MSNTHVVLGLDPGTKHMGYGVIELKDRKFVRHTSGTWSLYKTSEEAAKLAILQSSLEELLKQYKCESMAFEGAFLGKNVQAMLKLGRLQGVAMAVAARAGLACASYSPRTIKLTITGQGNAHKELLAKRIWHVLGEKLPHKSQTDETDALAAAVCHVIRS